MKDISPLLYVGTPEDAEARQMTYVPTLGEAVASVEAKTETVIPEALLEDVLRALGASEEWIHLQSTNWGLTPRLDPPEHIQPQG